VLPQCGREGYNGHKAQSLMHHRTRRSSRRRPRSWFVTVYCYAARPPLLSVSFGHNGCRFSRERSLTP
jgi:hypothetical protein